MKSYQLFRLSVNKKANNAYHITTCPRGNPCALNKTGPYRWISPTCTVVKISLSGPFNYLPSEKDLKEMEEIALKTKLQTSDKTDASSDSTCIEMIPCRDQASSTRDKDHRILAIASIICGLSCIGIVALINSVKVFLCALLFLKHQSAQLSTVTQHTI